MAITLYQNDRITLDFRMSKFLRNLIEEANRMLRDKRKRIRC